MILFHQMNILMLVLNVNFIKILNSTICLEKKEIIYYALNVLKENILKII